MVCPFWNKISWQNWVQRRGSNNNNTASKMSCRENTVKFKSYHKTGASCLVAVSNSPCCRRKFLPVKSNLSTTTTSCHGLFNNNQSIQSMSKTAEEQLLASCIMGLNLGSAKTKGLNFYWTIHRALWIIMVLFSKRRVTWVEGYWFRNLI